MTFPGIDMLTNKSPQQRYNVEGGPGMSTERNAERVTIVPQPWMRLGPGIQRGVNSYNGSGKVGDSPHREQAHLKSGSNGIALWPQVSQRNQPSTRSCIARNSGPSLQYGQRMIGTGRLVISSAIALLGACRSSHP